MGEGLHFCGQGNVGQVIVVACHGSGKWVQVACYAGCLSRRVGRVGKGMGAGGGAGCK